jgi:predicted Na+-dependent transporter
MASECIDTLGLWSEKFNIWEHCWWVKNATAVSFFIVFGLFGLGLRKLFRKKPDVNAGIFLLYIFFGLLVSAVLFALLGNAIENSFETQTPF